MVFSNVVSRMADAGLQQLFMKEIRRLQYVEKNECFVG
jgi:hypothetical protein